MRKLHGLIAAWIVVWPLTAGAADYLTDGKRLLQQGDVRAALLQLSNAVQADPKNAEAHYELGVADLQAGDPVAAEKEARTAGDSGFDLRAAMELLGQSYLAQGRFQDLLHDMPAGQQPDPAVESAVLVARGYASLALKHTEDAKASFDAAAKLTPQSAAATLGQARLALATGDVKTGIERLDRVLSLDPHALDALLLKAQALRETGDAKSALPLLDEAVAVAPGAFAAHLERAATLSSLNADEAAKAELDLVLKMRPGNIEAVYLQAVLAAKKNDFRTADADLDQIAIAMASIPRAYYLQAIVKSNLGQMERAIDAATKYARRNPSDLTGLKLLAELQLRQRQPEPVIRLLEPVAASGKADAQIDDLLGRAFALAGRSDDAIRSFQKAASLAPEDASIRTRLAETRLGIGEEDAAIGDLEQSLKLAPSQPQAGEALVFAQLAIGDAKGATQTLQALRAAQGDTEAVGNLDGMAKLAQLDLDGAGAAFQAVVKQFPDFMPAWMNLAKVAAMQGRTDDAQALLRAALDRQPTYGPAISALTEMLLRQGKAPDAVAVLQRARRAAPDNPALTAALADIYIQTGDAKQALTLFAPDPKQPTQDPVLLTAQARTQLALKMTDDAQATLRRLVALSPEAIEPRETLIGLLVAGKDFDGARRLVADGLTYQPGSPPLLADELRIDLQANGLKTALATADRLQQQNPASDDARALKGDAYMMAKRPDDAAAAYEAALQAAPSALLEERLVDAFKATGHPEKAMQSLRDWMSHHPDDMQTAQTLASLEIDAGQFDDAAAWLETILARRPHDPTVLNNLAWVYQEKGDPKALGLATQAYVLASSNAETADTLGWILTKQGEAEKGVALLRQASAQLPADPHIAYHLAVALKAVGQREAAIKLLNALVAAPHDFDEKPQAQQLLTELSRS